jgi:hypothetical protein
MPTADVLRAAVQAVEEAEVPEDLRSVAFGKAVDLLAGTAGRDAGVPAPAGVGAETPSGGGAAPSTGLQKIADAFAVQADRIEMIYTEHGDALQVVADPDDLGSSTKERAKSVALLVAAGRQLGGWDESATSDELVRAEVNRLGVYDPTNYAKHVKELTAWFNVNGAGKKATYKLKHAGRQHVKEMAARLTAE